MCVELIRCESLINIVGYDATLNKADVEVILGENWSFAALTIISS